MKPNLLIFAFICIIIDLIDVSEEQNLQNIQSDADLDQVRRNMFWNLIINYFIFHEIIDKYSAT